ncbi:MAG: MarR family transcriptional regulator, partial [Solirubrobacteraceae bacterium]|nr:MarR family transcriptional regulator [Solirubrobacteraceae bacterium]
MGAQAPSELAHALGLTRETISRVLADLTERELVTKAKDPADGRRWLCSLTALGEQELRDYVALLAVPLPELPVASTATNAQFESALSAAVARRAQTNDPEGVLGRLSQIRTQASAAGERHIELRAMAEMAATLRHLGDDVGRSRLLRELDAVAAGNAGAEFGPDSVPRAAAYFGYEQGRRLSGEDGGFSKRMEYLGGSVRDFERLGRQSARGAYWTSRAGWALVSMADELRGNSQHEPALHYAHEARNVFAGVEDSYGLCRAFFVEGFVQRLRGDFEAALPPLVEAGQLAETYRYQRFHADALMQTGEVLRCLGRLDEAEAALTDGLDRAERLRMATTVGFAAAALGAVEFARSNPGKAHTLLARAEGAFVSRGHDEGRALVARRGAVVQRAMRPGHTEAHQRYILDALNRYWERRSPAGVTAALL